MSVLPPPDLGELLSALGDRGRGLLLVRYQSAVALDGILLWMRGQLAPRPLHEVHLSSPDEGPASLIARCRDLAGPDVPVLVLRPGPGVPAEPPELATFWKQLNSLREALGGLEARIALCLDEAHSAAAFHHAKDLISWCTPKFEFTSFHPASLPDREVLAPARPDRLAATGAASAITWRALLPLWQQRLASGRPLTADDAGRLAIPLLAAAVDQGLASAGLALVREAEGLPFHNETERGAWLDSLGDLHRLQGDLPAALPAYRESFAIREQLAAADPTNAARQRDLSISFEKLGDVQLAQGNLAGAQASYEAARQVAAKLAAADPTNAEWQRDLTVSFVKLGDVQLAQGKLAGAQAGYEAARQVAAKLAAADPTNAAWQRDLSVSFVKLAEVAEKAGRREEALRRWEQALPLTERLAALDPTNATWQQDVRVCRAQVARLRGAGSPPAG